MVIDSPLIYLQQDFLSLQDYYQQNKVSISTVKRRMKVSLRNKDTSIPDHYIELSNSITFSKVNSFIDLFSIALPDFASKFLSINYSKEISVKEDTFLLWQDIINEISPLLLISCSIYSNAQITNSIDIIKQDLFPDFILKNTLNTALISPSIIQLETLVNSSKGFNDLHIHLNGIIESDAVWENILYDTDNSLSIFYSKINEESFLQELEQLGIHFSKSDITSLIYRAKELRNLFCDFCFSTLNNKEKFTSSIHPFSLLFDTTNETFLPSRYLRYEALMYVLVIYNFTIKENEQIAQLFHEYLLIKGFINKLLVHSKSKYGFEQFQNITKNDIRELADKNHLSKFLQLSGNRVSHFKNLELRFSPKESVDKNIETLSSIDNDFNSFLSRISFSNNTVPDYSLIAHFIKKKPNKNSKYSYLYKELQLKAENIVTYNNNTFKHSIVGIDAAASEFDTPPEVFAPTYKYLRQNGIHHFTYHAGEDFYHVLSGLRAIYEAVIFCNLQKGDRIGHACAVGIDISSWKSVVGNELFIPHGEYIDDLLFVYDFITSRQITTLYNLLPSLETAITTGYLTFFNKNISISEIVEFWKLRKENPYEYNFSIHSENIQYLHDCYNSIPKLTKYNEPIQIILDKDISINNMEILQKELLKFLHEKEIVIETLPTSNLRIGWHKNIETYQLFNWYKWNKEGYAIPPIVLGTDDPGIFQTNIFNEYALVYCYMVYNLKISRTEIMSFIQELYSNSEIYRFK